MLKKRLFGSNRLVFRDGKPEVPGRVSKKKVRAEKLEELGKKRREALDKVGINEGLVGPEESQETVEKISFKEKIFKDPETGFRLYAAVPDGYDGTVDMYFPGDTMGFKGARKTKPLLESAQEKWSRGKRSAFVIVEGAREHIRGGEKKRRYFKLRKRGRFSGVVDTIESNIGEVKKIHLVGHSRGGSALNFVLDKGGMDHKIEGVSLLDATYWDPKYLISYAKRGGRLNVVFQSHPKFLKRNPRPMQNAKRIVYALKLKKVDRGHWQSADKRVNVHDAGRISHRKVAQEYVGKFMEGFGVAGVPPVIAAVEKEESKVSAEAPKKVSEGLKWYLDKFEARKHDAEAMVSFRGWAGKQTEAEALRRGNVSAKENRDDVFEKHVRLAAEYIEPIEVNGHSGFLVDFKGNELAEWNIGAGHVLPPTIKAIRVYDRSGKVAFDYAERGILGGKVGYFVPETGQYARIHTGYKIEVLDVQAIDHKETETRIAEELDHFDLEQRKIVVKGALQKFLNRNLLEVVVDDAYFTTQMGDLMLRLTEDWWEDYLDDKFSEADFLRFFGNEFSGEDMNLLRNLTNLRNKGAYEEIYMSDFMKMRKDGKFEKLRGKMLNNEEVANFRKTELEGHDVSDVLLESDEVLSNEPFVESLDHFGNRVVLRGNAMKAFKEALKVAKSMGVKLKVVSSYRSEKKQAELFKRGVKKYKSKEAAAKWVARPGGSAHHTGGALDVVAVYKGRGGRRHKNQQLLKRIMSQSGFVNYRPEPWHWEIYTARWRKKTRERVPVYNRELALNMDDLEPYKEYRREVVRVAKPMMVKKDKALSKLLRKATTRVWRKYPKYCRPGYCEHNAGVVAEETLRLLFGEKRRIHIRKQPLDVEATLKLRGIRGSELTREHLAYLKPGVALFFVNPKKYERRGRRIIPGTTHKLSIVRETDRHWITWNGSYFIDNWGAKRSLAEMRNFLDNRVVVNVVDPYANYRNRFSMVGGKLEITV